MKTCFERTDNSNRAYYLLWGANRWLSWHIDLVGSMVALFAAFFAIRQADTVDASLAGFSLTFALSFTSCLLWILRAYGMNEMNMNSLERLKEFSVIEPEPPQIIPESRPPTIWPSALSSLSVGRYSLTTSISTRLA